MSASPETVFGGQMVPDMGPNYDDESARSVSGTASPTRGSAAASSSATDAGAVGRTKFRMVVIVAAFAGLWAWMLV